MKVETLYEKGVSEFNEDALLIKSPLFAVFDGAGSVTPWKNKDGFTSGYLASNTVKAVFEKSPGSLHDAALNANEALLTQMRQEGLDLSKREDRWCSTAAAVRIEENFFEWAQISDSLILTISKDKSFHLLAEDYFHDENVLLKLKAFMNKGTENPFAEMKADLIQQRQDANRLYGLLNGDPEAAAYIHSGTESLDNLSHILLFTDGLVMPKEDPTTPDDFAKMVEIFLRGGLSSVRAEVRRMQNLDADCRKFPRFKKHDDIAAIAIEL